MVRKSISVFLLVLFLAYSGGIGFSLHKCEHCHAVKVYIFQHPDCCPASEAEHHHGEMGEYAHGQCCSHSEEQQCPNEIPKISLGTYTAHCEQCCISEFVYFKIISKYIPAQYDNLFQFDNCSNGVILFGLSWEEGKLPQPETIENRNLHKEIPPLLPGGEKFIIYSHKLLFYS